jgi:hypothetical protein
VGISKQEQKIMKRWCRKDSSAKKLITSYELNTKINGSICQLFGCIGYTCNTLSAESRAGVSSLPTILELIWGRIGPSLRDRYCFSLWRSIRRYATRIYYQRAYVHKTPKVKIRNIYANTKLSVMFMQIKCS